MSEQHRNGFHVVVVALLRKDHVIVHRKLTLVCLRPLIEHVILTSVRAKLAKFISISFSGRRKGWYNIQGNSEKCTGAF